MQSTKVFFNECFNHVIFELRTHNVVIIKNEYFKWSFFILKILKMNKYSLIRNDQIFSQNVKFSKIMKLKSM